MKQPRGEFSSRLGFILAATGSAVGLGNVWGFPTNAASNGGAAFVMVYLVLAFCLAYPALMAELIIGRHSHANVVTALGRLSQTPRVRRLGIGAGLVAVLTASAILGFYSLVAGWMIAQFAAYAVGALGATGLAQWFAVASPGRDIACALVFSLATIAMVSEGVRNGIERWSTRLMPALMLLMLVLIGFVLFQPGAMDGLRVYLLPDFARILQPQLIVSALGQAFFSLSLGVGTMLVYGSYMPRSANLPAMGAVVTLVDVGIAFLAGLLILPAMFVASRHGIPIYQDGTLTSGPDLIFQVLPALFDSMGPLGAALAMLFFALMTIAALTSSISMLEVPTALLAETTPLGRVSSAGIAGAAIFLLTTAIALWFDSLFGLVVSATTQYSEPLMGIVFCLFAGWAIHRDRLLAELRQDNQGLGSRLFWRIWPTYVRFICPLLIAAAFIQSLR